MNIDNLNLPPHEHREYPKVVYEGGVQTGASRVVRHLLEEQEASADGFVAVAGPVAEAGTEEAFVQSQEHAPVAAPAKRKAAKKRK